MSKDIQQGSSKNMSKSDKDQVLEAFSQAYQAAHGKAPVIEAKGGWYSVDGGKNVRLAQLEEMTAELAGAKPAATKAEAKPAAKAASKAAPAKKAAKPAKAKKRSDFSVKAFWAEQLASRDGACKLPR